MTIEEVKLPRIALIDALKGWAILLVVFGHAIQFNSSSSFDQNIFFRLIYSFHMPLFMFLSGFVIVFSIRPGYFQVWKKFLALGIPFIIWAVIGFFYNNPEHSRNVWQALGTVFQEPDLGLWYLWVLFLNFCMLFIAWKLEPYLRLFSYVLIWIVLQLTPFSNYGVSGVRWYFLFFGLGYLVSRYRRYLIPYFRPLVVGALILFPILFNGWHRYSGTDFLMNWIAVNHIHLSVFLIESIRYLLPISGILLSVGGINLLRKTHLFSWLIWLGGYTLDIYAIHYYFITDGLGSGFLSILSAAIFAMSMALLISILIIRRVPVLNLLLLGGRAKKSSLHYQKSNQNE